MGLIFLIYLNSPQHHHHPSLSPVIEYQKCKQLPLRTYHKLQKHITEIFVSPWEMTFSAFTSTVCGFKINVNWWTTCWFKIMLSYSKWLFPHPLFSSWRARSLMPLCFLKCFFFLLCDVSGLSPPPHNGVGMKNFKNLFQRHFWSPQYSGL